MPVALPAVLPPCSPKQCGKDFRSSLRKHSPVYVEGKRKLKIRTVPAFTIQSLQKNTRVAPPRPVRVYEPRPLVESPFRHSYMRGEFPVFIQFTSKGKKLGWKIPVEKLDYTYYLPMLFDGLCEGEYPYNFVVENGIRDMIHGAPHKVLPAVPQIIIPLKRALETKNTKALCYATRCIMMLVNNCEKVGEAMVPYYRQLLPMMNLFKCRPWEFDPDKIVVRDNEVGFLIDDALQYLERSGGPDAFINIKYMVPTYESCMQN